MTTVSQIQKDLTAIFEADKDLRAVKLSDRINYLHCEGGESRDSHGVMVFTSEKGVPLFVKEVESREDFKLNFDVFKIMEILN
jgi:hypothetical protein